MRRPRQAFAPDAGRACDAGRTVGVDGDALANASRLIAKVDSAAVQDGFDLYLHGFIVSDEGRWTVVQQGMNVDRKQARRYHWLSEGMRSFVEEPHTAIEGRRPGQYHQPHGSPRGASRRKQIELLGSLGPERIAREAIALSAASAAERAAPTLVRDRWPQQPTLPHLVLPAHHDVRASDVHVRRLHGNLAAAAECGPGDFPDLLLTPGVGARTVRALALVAEVLHGAPCRFSDPARFSLAHGGKDRHPFPVPIKVYDETIRVMRAAVDKAKLGHEEKLFALRKLDAEIAAARACRRRTGIRRIYCQGIRPLS